MGIIVLMKTLILAALAGATYAFNDADFMSYLVKFNKSYESVEEYEIRRAVYHATELVI